MEGAYVHFGNVAVQNELRGESHVKIFGQHFKAFWEDCLRPHSSWCLTILGKPKISHPRDGPRPFRLYVGKTLLLGDHSWRAIVNSCFPDVLSSFTQVFIVIPSFVYELLRDIDNVRNAFVIKLFLHVSSYFSNLSIDIWFENQKMTNLKFLIALLR